MRCLAALPFLLLATGCVVGPQYVETPPTVPGQFASQPTGATTSIVEANWWSQFKDEQLNTLVVQAEEQNRDLKIATARLKEARALWTAARFDFVPKVTSDSGYTRTKTSSSGNFLRSGQQYDLYDVGLDATWELDLFGRVRNSVISAKATEAAVEAEHDALLIALRAEVAVNYLLLRGAQAQLSVAERNAVSQAESLRIAKASLEGGRGNQLDVARATAQWNATRATVPLFQIRIDQSAHRIAVLCGTAPSEVRETLQKRKPMPRTPATVALSEPTEVIRRRPDIRAAERQLASTTALVGVATADLFPQVTFNGSIGFEAAQLSNLGSGGTTAFGFGPRLSWAAFDLGRVRQLVKAAGARAEASLAHYEQTVLLALEEAENALTEYDRETVRLRFLRQSAASAEEAAGLARQRYKDGVSEFLDVLDAERVALAAQSEVVASEVSAAVAWVKVYKAMGGGWDPESGPKS